MTASSDGQRRGQRVGQTVDLAGPGGDPVGDAWWRPGPARRDRSRPSAADRRGRGQPRGRCRRTGRAARRPRRAARTGHDRDGHRLAIGPGRRPSTGSSRSAIGRRVVESGTPGRALTSVASRTRRIRTAARHDDVVRAGGVASSSTIAPRIASGDDRARQAGQDPRERFGLLAAADLERGDRLRCRIAANRRRGRARRRPSRPDATVRADPEDRDQAEDEEGGGEDPARRV